jgi:hypothetical protein
MPGPLACSLLGPLASPLMISSEKVGKSFKRLVLLDIPDPGDSGPVMHNRPASMTYFEAAVAVLRVSKRPMSAREIIDEAIAQGLLDPSGKTPVATLSARLYCHVRDAPEPVIERHAEAGPTRARRGSVRWSLRQAG